MNATEAAEKIEATVSDLCRAGFVVHGFMVAVDRASLPNAVRPTGHKYVGPGRAEVKVWNERASVPMELPTLRPTAAARSGNGHATSSKVQAARSMGYSGGVCDGCGGSRMRRSGTCETCDDCGKTSGCG